MKSLAGPCFAFGVIIASQACSSKSGGTDGVGDTETGASSEITGMATTSTATTSTTTGSGDTGSTGAADFTGSGNTGSSGTDDITSSGGPMPAVPCGDMMCEAGELCVYPGSECVEYEPGPEDTCVPGSIDFGCEEIVYPPPSCVSAPEWCDTDACLVSTFCKDSCFEDGEFVDGVLSCGSQWCHCAAF